MQTLGQGGPLDVAHNGVPVRIGMGSVPLVVHWTVLVAWLVYMVLVRMVQVVPLEQNLHFVVSRDI